jgi:arsenate reductase
MAEGLWRQLGKGRWEAFSAGSNPAGYVHPLAVEVMREVDADISEGRSKHVREFTNELFELAVTVCSGARDSCPTLPGAQNILHWPFDDPAHAEGSDEEKRTVFRRVRDEISARIQQYLNTGE